MKQAKALVTFALSLATLALAGPAMANPNVQSAIQRLDAAEQQLMAAQGQVSAAKQDLYLALQNNGPRWVCVYNYMNRQYRGEGGSEAEAKEAVIFECSSDRGNPLTQNCRYAHNKNGATQCRVL